MNRHPILRLLFCASVWFGLTLPLAAQNVVIHDVRVGFPLGDRDFHRAGAWVPVAVQFAPEPNKPAETIPATFQGSLTVETPDGEGAQTRFVVPVLNVTRDDVVKKKPFLAYIKLGNTSPEVRVTFHITQTAEGGNTTKADRQLTFTYPENRRNINEKSSSLSNQVRGDQRLVLALGNVAAMPLPLNPQEEDRLNYQVTQLTDPQRLPGHWYGYEGVNTVVLATGGTWTGSFAQTVSDTESLRGPLLQWVAHGGHLVIAVCSNAPQMKQSPLAVLYPAEIDAGKVQTRATLEGLRSYVEKVSKARPQGADIKPLVADVVGLKEKHLGVAMAMHRTDPVIVHAPYGLGRVTMLAFDVDGGGFLNWDNNSEFWKALLSLYPLAENRNSWSYDWDAQSKPGMEAAGNFATTMESFGEMPVVSFFLVAVFILGYILLIGPVDYFFLKKVAKRLEWTWITFPTLVLVVSVGAYFAAYYIKGDEMRLNKVDLIDLDLGHQRVAGNSWVTVFSPNLQKYDLQVTPQGVGATEGQPVISWLGKPGQGPRGFDRQQGPGLFRRDYEYGPDAASMVGVPIQVWGMKSFATRWQGTFKPAELLDARFTLNEQLALNGQITSRLPVTLTACRLMYKNLYWELGTLAPGQTLKVGGSGIPRNTLNDFRPLSAPAVTAHGKTLADFAAPLSELLYTKRSDDSPNRPPSTMEYLDQSWRLQRFDEVVFMATVDNRHGNAQELNSQVLFGTKLTTFTPALRGTLRQATFLRAFIPVEKQQR